MQILILRLQRQWDMYRNTVTSKKIALGCSHTYGTAVEESDAWPYKLGAMNFGVEGASIDLIARTLPDLMDKYTPEVVYILLPDWTRFEYILNGQYKQSLPRDTNRIYFMEVATEEWLVTNFEMHRGRIRDMCRDIKLVDLTLDDLSEYIDHADKWPLAKDNAHFDEQWHTWVAEIYERKT